MGIKYANQELLVVARNLYAGLCSARRAPCQVSGHIHSGTKHSSLPLSLVFCRPQNNSGMPLFGLSPSKQTRRKLGRAMVCVSRTSLAAEWPTCVPKRNGRTISWRPSCNAKAWTSAACHWRAWNGALPKSAIKSLRGFKKSFAFPSFSFSPKRFRI